jgi:DNA-binding NarL/FixJ family response regulator
VGADRHRREDPFGIHTSVSPRVQLAFMRCGCAACDAEVMRLRCVIVDDSLPYLEAATERLEGDELTVVGVAQTSDAALRQVRELVPDVVLVDVALGEESGFDLARRLAAAGSRRPMVVMISTQAEEDVADELADARVAGFVAKTKLSAQAIERLLG